MKTSNDFYIKDNTAILEGVTYAEESKVVLEYLKNNPQIKYVAVISKDGRRFELKNERLVFTKEETFINPYYEEMLMNHTMDESNKKKAEAKLTIINQLLNKLIQVIDDENIDIEKLSSLLDGLNK